MTAIEAIDSYVAGGGSRGSGRARGLFRTAIVLLGVAIAIAALPAAAFAGNAASGKPAFQPCDQCHPVFLDAKGEPTKPLPVGLKQHEIKLEVHDILGEGDKACLACHDAPTRNPGKLILPDGSLVDVTGDVSRVCQRCHFEKYQQWKAGIHGKSQPKCSAAGCHDPHSPSWIYVAALPPFVGTGFEVNAVGADREPFKPFAGPPVAPEVSTPGWLTVIFWVGLLGCLSIVGFLVARRPKR